MTLILPKAKIMVAKANEVAQITQPLRKHGISAFVFTRIYSDGTFIDMSDNGRLLDFYFYKTDLYNIVSPEQNPDPLTEGFSMYSTIASNIALQQFEQHLAISHVLMFCEKLSHYTDICYFSGFTHNSSILNFYLNNLNFLKSFVAYFKEKAKPLIQEFRQQGLIKSLGSPHTKETHLILPSQNNVLAEKLSYLTKKEIECLKLVAYGKSYKDIAEILCRSSKTIEKHLQSARDKLNCKKTLTAVRLLENYLLEDLTSEFFVR